MTQWLEKLVRPEIYQLKPYSSARSEFSGKNMIQLDANENPKPPLGQGTLRSSLNRYPEPQPATLKQKLADLYLCRPAQILMTRGMDEGIDLLIRTFLRPYQDELVICPPTFGYYEVSGNINGVKVVKLPLFKVGRDFTLDWQGLKKLTTAKLFFLCSPNNPTGNVLSLGDIKALCEAQKNQAIVAIDEAYIEFSDHSSASVLLDECENLVVMRTLSKAYSLAGARLGCLLAHPDIIEIVRKVLPPYPLPTPSIEAIENSLSPIGLAYARSLVAEIKIQRDLIFKALGAWEQIIEIYPSQANFVLAKVKNAKVVYDQLKAAGIIVRSREHDLEGTLRFSIGSAKENELLLSALGIHTATLKPSREATKARVTSETDVLVKLNLDGKGQTHIATDIGFFDHMLEQLGRHSGIDLSINAKGDTHIDPHHTVEDVAIVLGQALKEALGDKKRINRYGFLLPMDEAEAQISLDLSGRGYCDFDAHFSTPMLGDFPTEMVKHFFTTLSTHLEAALHIKIKGENCHHMVEGCFKAFAKALRMAINETGVEGAGIPSTKGIL